MGIAIFITSLLTAVSGRVKTFVGGFNTGVRKASPHRVRTWLDELPPLLRRSLQDEHRSIALIYALLLDPYQPRVKSEQLQYLQRIEDSAIFSHIPELYESIATNVDSRWHLPLLDLAIERLELAPVSTRQHLLKCTSGMMDAVASSSWRMPLANLILEHCLHPQTSVVGKSDDLALENLWIESMIVLATIARAGQRQPDATLHAFQAGLFRLPNRNSNFLMMPDACDWQELQVCLEKLAHVKLSDRKILVTACTEVISSDRQASNLEADLLRMMAIMLDCPLPPLLDRPRAQRPSSTLKPVSK
jgi:hypothetical protein